MNPQAGADDDGYFQSYDGSAVNRPLPTLSAPRSPGVIASEASQHLPSPSSPLPRHETIGPADDRSSSVSSIRRQTRSDSPASNKSNATTSVGHAERDIIVRSYAPHVAVYPSADVDQLIADKGLRGGLATLLRPFGERIQGKVIIRDSHGISRAWEDFGIRIHGPDTLPTSISGGSESKTRKGLDHSRPEDPTFQKDGQIDWATVLKPSLDGIHPPTSPSSGFLRGLQSKDEIYANYLQKLLSSNQIVPYETFNHPIACLVAVSSRNNAPIESLRQLYAMTSRTNPNIPAWMSTDYLRYYILVHDEDKDDISKSVALFDLMKRHFGLHCHLLRLKSSQCASTDDDSFRLPPIEWLSAEESNAMTQREGNGMRRRCPHVSLTLGELDSAEDLEDSERSVSEADANAIIAFIREMVTQSIIPFMENRMTAWNDQVASRKRGIGGRFMSISKRWAGFGSSKSTSAAGGPSGNPTGSNYNVELEIYAPETPEAIIRSLADHAMMLRDWRLAYNTYELMRSDFSHDKAWAYHAAATEMTALSSLLVAPQHSRLRLENVDQWLDAAIYSYLTRCSLPDKAKRCLLLATELLHGRDLVSADRAPTWAARLLEISVLGTLEQCLVTERIANAYSTKPEGTLQIRLPRHAAMWTLLASLSWVQIERPVRAESQLKRAQSFYTRTSDARSSMPFLSMMPLWGDLTIKVRQLRGDDTNEVGIEQERFDIKIENPTQTQIDTFVTDTKSHSRRPSHFARRSEIVDKVPFTAQNNSTDGFE